MSYRQDLLQSANKYRNKSKSRDFMNCANRPNGFFVSLFVKILVTLQRTFFLVGLNVVAGCTTLVKEAGSPSINETTQKSTQSNLSIAERMDTVPVTEADGTVRHIQLRLCFPSAEKTRFRVVILNHGSPPQASNRPFLQGILCKSEPARWFLSRNYLVAAPIRRGYGASEGVWSESFGSCGETTDFWTAGLETARDINAVVEYVSELPEAKQSQMVVVGQSAGGWGTIAYNSTPHPRVSAMINMAGGRGGHRGGVANKNCRPDLLAKAAARYGESARTPMLWMYTTNDSFFAPTLAESLFEAFSSTGGQAKFQQLPPFRNDGHSIFLAKDGSAIWGPAFEEYLKEHP